MSQQQYFKQVFGTCEPNKGMVKAELNRAHDIRQFEIRLYWQRSLFFWGFMVTFFGAFGYLMGLESQTLVSKAGLVVLSMLGSFTAWAWLVTEIGAKSWQRNWELHIDYLEDEITGALHKTTLGKSAQFYSISTIHRTFIFAVIFAWLVLGAAASWLFIKGNDSNWLFKTFGWPDLLLMSLGFVNALVIWLIAKPTKRSGFWRTSAGTVPRDGIPPTVTGFHQRGLPKLEFPNQKDGEG